MFVNATNLQESAANEATSAANITDKKGYAARWKFSVRKVDDLLQSGLPHLKIGERRVRIIVPQADRWMEEKFSRQRS